MTIDAQCPNCKSKAKRIIDDTVTYIYCVTCGANIIARTISNQLIKKYESNN